MKTLLLLFAFCISLACHAQQIPKNTNKTDKKGRRQGNWTLTYDKAWQPTTLKDSITYYRLLAYKDDKPQGLTTDYYLSGKKQWEARLVADRPKEIADGKAIWYHENGEVSSEVMFVLGLKEGGEIAYYQNKKKYSESLYKNGLIQNNITYYDEDGNINNIEFYENGGKLSLQNIWDKAMVLYNEKAYKEAENLFKNLYIAIKYVSGKDSDNCAQILNYLWTAQTHLEKYAEAETNITEMCRTRELQKISKDSTYRDWLYETVLYYKNNKKLENIETPLLKILKIQAEITGEDNANYLAYKRTLGDLYRAIKRYAEAEKIFTQNIEQLKKQYPNQPNIYTQDLVALGAIYENKQAYTKAENIYKDAIKQYKSNKDTTEKFANLIESLIEIYQPQNKNLEAVQYAQDLVGLQKIRKGINATEYRSALLKLSNSYRDSDQFEKARGSLRERSKITIALFGENGYEYANDLFFQALLNTEENDIESARKYYTQSVSILKNMNDTHKENDSFQSRYAEILAYFGELCATKKDFINALINVNLATEKANNLKNKGHFAIAQIYEKIGTVHFKINNYEEAETAYKEAARVAKNIYGENHHNYIQSEANLCVLYTYSNRPAFAIEKLNVLLNKVVEQEGKDTPSYIALLTSKRVALDAIGTDSTNASVDVQEEITAFYKRNYGEESQTYSTQLAQLVNSQILANKLDEAQINLDKLQILADKKGVKTIDKAYYNNLLAMKIFLANTQKNYAKAIEYAQEQNAIGRFLGQPKMGLVHLALASFSAEKFKNAADYYKTYINFVLEDIRKVFPYLSEIQKTGFYKAEMEYHLDLYNFIALSEPLKLKIQEKISKEIDSINMKKIRVEREKIRYIYHPNNADIFNYQLITKGLLFEAGQKMKEAILNSQDVNLIKIFKEWQIKKEEMNATFQEFDSRAKEDKKNKLSVEIKNIEQQLALKSSYFTQKLENKNYKWQDVQKKLKKGEALVEIITISAGQKMNKDKEETTDLYLAFVITPETKDYPLCVKLGTGDSLEKKYINNYQNRIKFQKADNYSYQKYWKALADTLQSAKKIYFAPDGVYHKININTLQNPETGKFVIEEKEIQLITQARDFITLAAPNNNLPTNIVLFGSPNFNDIPIQDSTLKNKERINKVEARAILQDTTQRFLHGSEIATLPGTETEVNNIANTVQAYNIQTQKYLGNDANEENIKKIQNPSVLHIATHGFFMPQNSTQTTTKEDSDTQRGGYAGFSEADLKNPLRRAGLLFAYCRQAFSQEKNNTNSPEDGILTAEEAQNLHLDKTDLVTLSACETGLGEVQNGEGVYGLQRALQTAGAKSILMSLWTVSDEATQELMSEFYRQWFKTKNKRQAFRNAQLWLKEKYPAPYFWGAFILVGE